MPAIWSSTSTLAVITQLSIVSMIVQIFAGMAIWEIGHCILLDWSIAKGRRACRYSLLASFLCCHLGLGAIACTIVFLCRYYQGQYFDSVLLYTAQTLQRISHCAAYMILTTRAVAVCKNDFVNWILGLTHLVLWAILLLSLQQYSPRYMIMRPDAEDMVSSTYKATRFMTSIPFIVISIVFSTATLWGFIKQRTHDPALRDASFWSRANLFCRKLCAEGFHCYVILIAVQVPLLIVDASRIDESGLLRFMMNEVSYMTTVICASRVFRLIVSRSADCPVRAYCMFYRLYRDYRTPKQPEEGHVSAVIQLDAMQHQHTNNASRARYPVGIHSQSTSDPSRAVCLASGHNPF